MRPSRGRVEQGRAGPFRMLCSQKAGDGNTTVSAPEWELVTLKSFSLPPHSRKREQSISQGKTPNRSPGGLEVG